MPLPVEIQAQLEKIQAIISEFGAELVDTGFRHTGSRRVIVFIVDKAGGIGLDDCSQINRRLCHLFDELAAEAGEGSRSLMSSPYLLEVNSPGLDRPLKAPKDFLKVLNRKIRVLYKNEAGHVGPVLVATLAEVTDDKLRLLYAEGAKELWLDLEKIVKATREISFKK